MKDVIYALLPVGTRIVEGDYEGAKAYVLTQPAVTAIYPKFVYKGLFYIEAPSSLHNKIGQPIETGLRWNYVVGKPENFKTAETRADAWK